MEFCEPEDPIEVTRVSDGSRRGIVIIDFQPRSSKHWAKGSHEAIYDPKAC